MRVLAVIVLLEVYAFCDTALSRFIKLRLRIRNHWKTLCFKAPFLLVISLAFIWGIGLSWSDAGFTLGNTHTGFKLVLWLGLPAALMSAAAIFLIPTAQLEQQAYGSVQKNPWQLVYVWLIVGPVEETIYRSFVQTVLNSSLSRSLWKLQYGTIAAAVIFVAVHYLNVLNKSETRSAFIAQSPGRLAIALVLGYLLQATGSIIYSMIAHNLLDGLTLTALNLRLKRIHNAAAARQSSQQA